MFLLFKVSYFPQTRLKRSITDNVLKTPLYYAFGQSTMHASIHGHIPDLGVLHEMTSVVDAQCAFNENMCAHEDRILTCFGPCGSQ